MHQAASGWSPVYVSQDGLTGGDGDDDDDVELGVMSIGFLLPSEDDAVIWRGPRKNGLIKQFLTDVDWGELDYLLIDTPPGTSDEHISLVQFLTKALNPQDGALVVSTPQEVSLMDVRKELSFCVKTKLRVLGVIENMCEMALPIEGLKFRDDGGNDTTEAALAAIRAKCPELLNYKAFTEVFPRSHGGAEAMAQKFSVPFLGRVPLDPYITKACESGTSYTANMRVAGHRDALAHIVKQLRSGEPEGFEGSGFNPAGVSTSTANGDMPSRLQRYEHNHKEEGGGGGGCGKADCCANGKRHHAEEEGGGGGAGCCGHDHHEHGGEAAQPRSRDGCGLSRSLFGRRSALNPTREVRDLGKMPENGAPRSTYKLLELTNKGSATMTPGSSASCSSHRRVVALTIASLPPSRVATRAPPAAAMFPAAPPPVLSPLMALERRQSPTMWWITSRCSTRTHAPLAFFAAGNHRPPERAPESSPPKTHLGPSHLSPLFILSGGTYPRSGSTTSSNQTRSANTRPTCRSCCAGSACATISRTSSPALPLRASGPRRSVFTRWRRPTRSCYRGGASRSSWASSSTPRRR